MSWDAYWWLDPVRQGWREVPRGGTRLGCEKAHVARKKPCGSRAESRRAEAREGPGWWCRWSRRSRVARTHHTALFCAGRPGPLSAAASGSAPGVRCLIGLQTHASAAAWGTVIGQLILACSSVPCFAPPLSRFFHPSSSRIPTCTGLGHSCGMGASATPTRQAGGPLFIPSSLAPASSLTHSLLPPRDLGACPACGCLYAGAESSSCADGVLESRGRGPSSARCTPAPICLVCRW